MTRLSNPISSLLNSKRLQVIATVGLIACWSLSAGSSLQEDASGGSAARLEGRTYEVDPVHSGVLFKIRHLGLSWCWGRFMSFEGSLVYGSDPASCSVQMTIDPSSLDTGSSGRDGHVKGADFLNVAQFPDAGFRSTKVSAGKDGGLKIVGMFSLHGVEKEVEIESKILGQGDRGERFGERIGFEGSFRFNRRDFGIRTYPDTAVGDEVEVIIAIEGMLK